MWRGKDGNHRDRQTRARPQPTTPTQASGQRSPARSPRRTTPATTPPGGSGTATSTAARRSSPAAAASPTCRPRSPSPGSPASPLSVRGGGHSAPGYGTNDGGLVLDLSPMKGIRVDPVARTARARGRRAVARARPRDAGVRPRHHRRHRVEHRHRRPDAGRRARLADGQARAHRRQPALRRRRDRRRHLPHRRRRPTSPTCSGRCGAAAGTSASSRPSSTGSTRSTEVLGGLVAHPLPAAGDVLRFYRDFCPTLPDEAEAYCGLLTHPEAGMPVVALLLGYNGPIDEGERVLRAGPGVRPATRRPRGADALRRAPDACSTIRTPSTASTATGARRSPSSSTTASSTPWSRRRQRSRSPLSALLFFYVHGAATRVPSGDTAFAARRPQWDFDAIGCWGDGAESDRHISWVQVGLGPLRTPPEGRRLRQPPQR